MASLLPDDVLLAAEGLTKIYSVGAGQVVALDHISFEIRRGELVSIVGASGSGKSTLLSILGCLDRPSEGAYRVAGVDTRQLDDDELSAIRNLEVGFIFQAYHLIPSLTALENVELPLFYRGWTPRKRRELAESNLAKLGLADRMHHYPEELSGGQKQRAAIARALTGDAPLLLADEPTGNLDSKTGAETLELLLALSGEGRTVLIVTHDLAIAAMCPRTIRLADGHIIEDGRLQAGVTALEGAR